MRDLLLSVPVVCAEIEIRHMDSFVTSTVGTLQLNKQAGYLRPFSLLTFSKKEESSKQPEIPERETRETKKVGYFRTTPLNPTN